MAKVFTGAYKHKKSAIWLNYEARYRFSAVGVVYEADALFASKRARLVAGVILWGPRALPPRRRVEAAIRETIDIVDIQKLQAKAE
jgi:hypothetical protein